MLYKTLAIVICLIISGCSYTIRHEVTGEVSIDTDDIVITPSGNFRVDTENMIVIY